MINVAYNEFLTYNGQQPQLPNSNVAKYDIHPWHTLDYHRLNEIEKKFNIKFPYKRKKNESKELQSILDYFYSQQFEIIVDNSFDNFTPWLLNDICETLEPFIYPIILYNNDLFDKYDTIDLDPKLIKSVKNKRAKICFIQSTEGFFGHNLKDYRWISNFQKKFNFHKEDTIIITSNVNAKNDYNKLVMEGKIYDNYTVFPYSYFQHVMWFAEHGGHLLSENVKESLNKIFNNCLNNNRTTEKEFHFLSFNRVIKEHRIAIFGEIMNNEDLKNKSIVTIGKSDLVNNFFNLMSYYIKEDYIHSKKKLLDFFNGYDNTKHYVYDEPDLENNKASVFNIDAHTKSFVNIVTESLVYENTVFFSEKTYKPIIACQPFIIFGNPYSLKVLKEFGFKTFDKWWDESYDNEVDFTRRLEKIVTIMKEISTWSIEKCFQITNEMEEILIHNFNVTISSDEILKLHKLLEDKNIKRNLI